MGKAITGLWVEAEEDGAGSLQAAWGGLAAASQGVQEKGVQAGGPTKAEAGLRELLKRKYGHCPTSFQSQSPRWVEKSQRTSKSQWERNSKPMASLF